MSHRLLVRHDTYDIGFGGGYSGEYDCATSDNRIADVDTVDTTLVNLVRSLNPTL